MTYVFGRTGGNAQKHLSPRYNEGSEDLFLSDVEMIDHLAAIYEDPYKVQNARLDYKSLMMKPSESFADFHTRFLHLAGEAKIPKDDLRPDLFDKLTMELQRTVLPVYSTLTTAKSLADECLSLDQGLRRLKARSDRVKARTTSTPSTAPPTKTPTTYAPRNSSATPAGTSSREATPDRIRPSYPDPATQALSDQGACFTCGKKGHIARDCWHKGKERTPAIQEVDAIAEPGKDESGKGEP